MAARRSPISSLISKELLTTGEAAALCSVTPDTVLKWIRAGKIAAKRTPGGHHRIPRNALQPLLDKGSHQPTDRAPGSSFRYCWEFYARDSRIPSGCRSCIVFRSRSRRCYEMNQLPAEAGFTGLFCKSSCDECEYYQLVHGRLPNVLVVTDRSRLRTTLERGAKTTDFSLEFSDCEYRCSMQVEKFRPDYIVIDCSLGIERSYEFAKLLYEDPRIPLVRVVLVAEGMPLPTKCDKLVYAVIQRPFSVSILSDLVQRYGSNRQTNTESRSQLSRPETGKGG